MLLSGMQQFPALLPPTVDHADDWLVVHNDEAQLAQEEAELEEKWTEVRTTNEGLNPIGKTALENDQEDYEPDAEDEDADNGEEESEGAKDSFSATLTPAPLPIHASPLSISKLILSIPRPLSPTANGDVPGNPSSLDTKNFLPPAPRLVIQPFVHQVPKEVDEGSVASDAPLSTTMPQGTTTSTNVVDTAGNANPVERLEGELGNPIERTEGEPGNPDGGVEGQVANPVEGLEGEPGNPVEGTKGEPGNPDGGVEGQVANPVEGSEGEPGNPVEGTKAEPGNPDGGLEGQFANPVEGLEELGNPDVGLEGQAANPFEGFGKEVEQQLGREGIDWEVGRDSKFCCKAKDCKFGPWKGKWALRVHLSKVHGLSLPGGKSGRPSTRPGGPRVQDHDAMNAKVMGDVMKRVRKNHLKALENTRKKAKMQYEQIVQVASSEPEVEKPDLAKLIDKKLETLLGISQWGHGTIHPGLWAKFENSEVLMDLIVASKAKYALPFKAAWKKGPSWEQSKAIRKQYISGLLKYHATELVHSRIRGISCEEFVINAVVLKEEARQMNTVKHHLIATQSTREYKACDSESS